MGGWVRGMPQTHLPFPRNLLQKPWTFTTKTVDIYYKNRGLLLQKRPRPRAGALGLAKSKPSP